MQPSRENKKKDMCHKKVKFLYAFFFFFFDMNEVTNSWVWIQLGYPIEEIAVNSKLNVTMPMELRCYVRKVWTLTFVSTLELFIPFISYTLSLLNLYV